MNTSHTGVLKDISGDLRLFHHGLQESVGIGILLLRNISTPEYLKVVVVNLLLPVKAQLWPDFVHVVHFLFFGQWLSVTTNKVIHSPNH